MTKIKLKRFFFNTLILYAVQGKNSNLSNNYLI